MPDEAEAVDSPTEDAAEPQGMSNSEVCIPSSAVEADSEDGGKVPPAVGDTVTVQLSGRVTRADGDNIYFTPATANGQNIEAPMTDQAQAEQLVSQYGSQDEQ